MAHEVYRRFVSHCDLGVDLHSSTRNRTTTCHVHADMSNPDVERLAGAFGANVSRDGGGDREEAE
jgi:predicted deacylase